MESDLIKIGALWTQTSAKGERYLSGKLGDARLLVLKNNFKDTEKHPDLIVYVAPYKKKDEEPGEPPVETSQEDLTDPIPF